MPGPPIGLDEWLAEVARLSHGSAAADGFLTVREIAKATGATAGKVRALLAAAAEHGLLDVGRKKIGTLAGGTVMVPCYRRRPPPGRTRRPRGR